MHQVKATLAVRTNRKPAAGRGLAIVQSVEYSNAKLQNVRRNSTLADHRLPGVRRGLGDGCHAMLPIRSVPKLYRMTQGLKAKNAYLIDKYGGQARNRTTDTGIFSRCHSTHRVT